MGTNYYWSQPPCAHCGRSDPRIHIGKSSAGWAFSLHVYPDDGINSLDDWEAKFKSGQIHDEYGKRLMPDEMVERIAVRHHPRGLSRHPIDGRCIGHGPGPWDLIVGDFS